MRVLHFLPVWEPAWQFGGPIRSVLQICEGLQSIGAEVKVITTNVGIGDHFEIKLGSEIIRSGVSVTYFPATLNELSIISSPKLLESASEYLEWADVFHISAIWHPIGLELQQMAFARNVPFVHSLRGALSPYSFSQKFLKKIPYYFLLERPLLSQASAIHVTSSSEYSDSLRSFLCLPKSLQRFVIPNISEPCDSLVNNMDKPDMLSELDFNAYIPTLLLCGRIDHKKGLDLLPQVLDSVQFLQWNLLIVGSDHDSSLSKLMVRLNKFSANHQIKYLGLLPPSQLPFVYSISDLLLMPSRHENFGNVALEALKQGCQVLLSSNVGIVDHLTQINHSNSWGASLPRQQSLWSSWLESWLYRYSPANRYVMSDDFRSYFSSQRVSSLWLDSYTSLIS